MSPALALLVALSFAADPATAERSRTVRESHERTMAEQARYTGVWNEWRRLHSMPNAHAQLVIDPREQAIWIEDQGKILGDSVVNLPEGFRWYAFYITPQGIVERSFPLRLTTPRPDLKKEPRQELFVLGLAKEKWMRFTYSAFESGDTFHGGSGSGTPTITYELPPVSSDGEPTESAGFLAPQSPHRLKPQETITKDGVTIQVKRLPTPAKAE